MKKYGVLILFLALAVPLVGGRASAAPANPYKLKPGASGKLCLNCHVQFQDKIKSPFVHTPVKTGECSACHSPHASMHGKLLAEKGGNVCAKCHKGMIPAKARSVHKVVVEGNCDRCHDPHAAKNKFNLLKAGNDLCFGCHKDFGDRMAKVKFKHSPVQKGCLACHNPHASPLAESLLKEKVPALCLKCHKADRPAFVKQHMNYPVAKARCTSCHNPHGSNQGNILHDTVHRPMANKMCGQCHVEPNSPTPFATKKTGFELCKSCHSAMVNDTFNRKKLHWALADTRGCLNCHNPHASSEKALVKGPMIDVCGSCHPGTLARQERSVTKHPPIQEGQCASCHTPHSSDNAYLFRQASIVDVCGACHDWQKHSSHPLGDKVIDPRNRNLTVQCLSCHKSHGNQNKAMLHFIPISEMCTQCHTKYMR